jgi:hypothetical protein
VDGDVASHEPSGLAGIAGRAIDTGRTILRHAGLAIRRTLRQALAMA